MTTTAPPARSLSIGIGVGAIVTNDEQQVFLARRGPQARNEQGLWACPGGALALGETLEAAIRREYREEFGMEIEVVAQLAAFDHLLPDGEQWVSVAFLARHVAGEPRIYEPGKCSDCGWFKLDDLPQPLSPLADAHLSAYRGRQSLARETRLRTWQDAHRLRAISPDGFLVACAEEPSAPRVTIMLLGLDHAIATYDGHRVERGKHIPHITALAWLPDSIGVASGASDGSLHVWDARTGERLRRLLDREEGAPVQSLAWDGAWLVAMCATTVREWRV